MDTTTDTTTTTGASSLEVYNRAMENIVTALDDYKSCGKNFNGMIIPKEIMDKLEKVATPYKNNESNELSTFLGIKFSVNSYIREDMMVATLDDVPVGVITIKDGG